MKRTILVSACILLLLVPICISGEDFGTWLAGMKEVHPAYKRALLDRETAELTKKRDLIEAGTEGQRLNTEIAYINTLISIRVELQSFYRDTADAAFTVAIEDIDYEIAGIREKIAGDDFERALLQYEEGLASEEEVEEKRIVLVEAERALLEAGEARKDANTYFTYSTGREWTPALTGLFSLFVWLPEKEAWMEADYALAKARLQTRLTEYRLDSLAANAPAGEKRLTEIGAEQARLAEEAALFDSERRYAKTVLNLRSRRQEAELLSRKQELEEELAKAAFRRFEEGAASEQEYDLRRISALQAERNRLEAVLDFVFQIFEAVLISGSLPEEVLR